tara:strand:+ start:817 stop:1488 length:672 start_codon:yes stop_codon:yes gene_type:complete
MKKLPKQYQKIYKEFYKNYSSANSFFRRISLLVEKWYHLQAANAYPKADKILEIGAGNLNHLKFEKNFKKYDVIEPKNYLLEIASLKNKKKVNNKYADIKLIPKNSKYDKIIAIAVIEHIENLELLFSEINLHLKKEGKLVIEIPAEGEFLWWLGWRMTTGIGFWLKYKLDYGVIMKYEHVNNAKIILNKIEKFFKIEKIKSFPLNIQHARLYIHIVCSKKHY